MHHSIIAIFRLLLTLYAALFCLNSVSSNKLYISTDQFGNKVFTDKKPKSGSYETKHQKGISTVVWEKPIIYPKIESRHKDTKDNSDRKKSKTKQVVLTKKQTCEGLLSTMSSLERQLEVKQKARQFDSLKKDLLSTRWQYQVKC
jgi:hypothetical protein